MAIGPAARLQHRKGGPPNLEAACEPGASVGSEIEPGKPAIRTLCAPPPEIMPYMSGIFIERNGELVSMTTVPYSSEDVFQELLGRHPALLVGDQLAPGLEPRRFVLVRREAGVPDAQDAANRWSLDHLFLDQDGVPTLVEVKRSSDTRIRREVVGQMLDYAANAVVYWPVDRLMGDLETTHQATGGSITQLRDLLKLDDESPDSIDAAIESYWQQVAANLSAGRVRLLFVADALPPELRRVIEFLNQQMAPAEVLGIEIQNYEGEGLRALIPRIVGLTEAAREHKNPTSNLSLAELWKAAPESVHAARRKLDHWASERGFDQIDLQKSRRYGRLGAKRASVLLYPSYNAVYFSFDLLRPDRADELHATLETLLGRPAAPKEPSVRCATLVDRWTEFESQFLTPFVEATAGLSTNSDEPSTSSNG